MPYVYIYSFTHAHMYDLQAKLAWLNNKTTQPKTHILETLRLNLSDCWVMLNFRGIIMLCVSWVRCHPVYKSRTMTCHTCAYSPKEGMCFFQFKDGTTDEYCLHQTSLSCWVCSQFCGYSSLSPFFITNTNFWEPQIWHLKNFVLNIFGGPGNGFAYLDIF